MTITNIDMVSYNETELQAMLEAEIKAEYEADERWEALCEEFFKEQEEALYQENEPVILMVQGIFNCVEPLCGCIETYEVHARTEEEMLKRFHKEVQIICEALPHWNVAYTAEEARQIACETLEIKTFYE